MKSIMDIINDIHVDPIPSESVAELGYAQLARDGAGQATAGGLSIAA